MSEFEDQMNHEIDIASWDNEGGALPPQTSTPKSHRNLIVCLGLIVVLPLVYFLAVKK